MDKKIEANPASHIDAWWADLSHRRLHIQNQTSGGGRARAGGLLRELELF